ncbi:MAG: heavy metal-responsive transcriptional regulator [Acidobacteriota bacterium]
MLGIQRIGRGATLPAGGGRAVVPTDARELPREGRPTPAWRRVRPACAHQADLASRQRTTTCRKDSTLCGRSPRAQPPTCSSGRALYQAGPSGSCSCVAPTLLAGAMGDGKLRPINRLRPSADWNVKVERALDSPAGWRVSNDTVGQLLIGDVARHAGVAVTTIRYYETIGLLPAPVRTSGGYRKYDDTTLQELQFIRKAQALGFSLDEIGEILTLSRSGETPCARVLDLAQRHLAAVQERIGQLTRFRDQLSAEVSKWKGSAEPTCRGYCQIIAGAEIDDAPSGEPMPLPRRTSQKRARHVV